MMPTTYESKMVLLLVLAQHECDSYNLINTTECYIIKSIELTTDSFMESVLTSKDSK